MVTNQSNSDFKPTGIDENPEIGLPTTGERKRERERERGTETMTTTTTEEVVEKKQKKFELIGDTSSQSISDFKPTWNEDNTEISLKTEEKIDEALNKTSEDTSEDDDPCYAKSWRVFPEDEGFNPDYYIEVPPPSYSISDEDLAEYYRQVKRSEGFEVQRFKGMLPGAISPCIMDKSTKQRLTHMSKLALQEYNHNNNGANFEFVKIVRATHQCVAGFLYYITFDACNGDMTRTFRCQVWAKVADLGYEIDFCKMT